MTRHINNPRSSVEHLSSLDGSPAWFYTEDGYCTDCGAGYWKFHYIGCHLRDVLDATEFPRQEERDTLMNASPVYEDFPIVLPGSVVLQLMSAALRADPPVDLRAIHLASGAFPASNAESEEDVWVPSKDERAWPTP